MAAKKPGAQATVTLKHLAADLAETHEMSKKQTEAVLGDLVGLVSKHLKKGDRIRIGGLGILVVRKRAAREGRNPATGETIHIKASKKVAFRAAKELKEAVMSFHWEVWLGCAALTSFSKRCCVSCSPYWSLGVFFITIVPSSLGHGAT